MPQRFRGGADVETMSIISRYIFRQALSAVAMILGSLTVIVWLAVALRQLEFMASQGQTTGLFFKLTALALPSLLTFIAPIALLIAIVHTLNRLNGDSELIVTTAGGASTWRLARPLLVLATLMAVVVSAVSHVFGPLANRTLRDLALEARADLITQVLQPGRFTTPEPKLTIHIRDRLSDGTMLGLLVNDARDETSSTSYLAETARMVRQGNAMFLLMNNGHILRKQTNGAADVVVFDRYAVDINRFDQKPETSGVSPLKPRERSTAELLNPDPKDPYWRDQPGRYRQELHDRLSGPVYLYAYVFLALAFIGHPQTTRQNRTLGLVLAVSAGFGLRLLGINFVNQSLKNPGAVVMIYVVPLVGMLLAMASISLNMRPKLFTPRRAATSAPAMGGS
jgi:lipopolysaccharide export system permease protein